MTTQTAFTTLLADIQAALHESLACSNAATQQGDFDTGVFARKWSYAWLK